MSTTNRILHGDCRQTLRTLADCSVDSIVTDPPYELGFMGKHWDASGIAYNVDLWRECLRVLKPGGHLLAFGGTRTYHRMAVAIEDAGFEVRDSIHWLYGSGFPKSLDVSKAIDKQRHDREDVLKVTNWIADQVKASGVTHAAILCAFGFNAGSGMVGHWTARTVGSQPSVPTLDQVPTLLDVLGVDADDVPDDIRRLLWDLNGPKGQPGENWAKREVVGTAKGGIVPDPTKPAPFTVGGHTLEYDITTPATDAARQWEGWGTALKPAHEPIVVARKPLIGTVAANVLEHGTGALNIDGCRVAAVSGDEPLKWETPRGGIWRTDATATATATATGRWPANLVLTHAADCADTCAAGCPVAELDRQSGTLTSGANPTRRGPDNARNTFGGYAGQADAAPARGIDTGGASRFFTVTEWDLIADEVPFRYVAKPSKAERNAGLDGLPEKNKYKAGGVGGTGGKRSVDAAMNATSAANCHPTVKPVALMRWLVRLVTPPGGTVLDPFLGSGTTAVAAVLEGFDWVGCEMTDEYLPIIEGRVAWAQRQIGYVPEARIVATADPDQLELFS